MYVFQCLISYPPGSLLSSSLQISLGSIFWPVKTPEKMWAFLDVIMELKKPFVSERPYACGRKAHHL